MTYNLARTIETATRRQSRRYAGPWQQNPGYRLAIEAARDIAWAVQNGDCTWKMAQKSYDRQLSNAVGFASRD